MWEVRGENVVWSEWEEGDEWMEGDGGDGGQVGGAKVDSSPFLALLALVGVFKS